MKSDEAFSAEQSLEAKLGDLGLAQVRRITPSTAPDEGTPVETVEAEETQPRNELGQFASTEPEAEAESTSETPPEGQTTQENHDPAVAAFLAKYGGDVTKALAGAVHLQRKSGEQSNEVGELRRMVDELSQLRESFQQQPQNQVLDQATVDWFDQQALENPHGAAEYARQQGNDILLQRALGTWKDIDPYGASVYTNDLRLQQQQQQFEQRLQQIQQLPMDATVHMALTNVMSTHPEFSNYDDALADVLQRYPSVQEQIQLSAASGDRAKLEAAIEAAFALAQGDTLRDLALAGPAPAETTTMSDVVAPTVSEPHEVPPEPTKTDQFRAAFQQEMDQRRRGAFVAE